MTAALHLATRGRGFVSPNPMVGAVVVADGEVVGEGWHPFVGGPHAEIEALRAAGPRARGADLYVTLEPCNHAGRTPPCAPAVAAAGIRRVVVAVADPNPSVAGGGVACLRARGIEVVVGVCEAEARALNRVFFTWAQERRPFVTLKTALTLDGRISTRTGHSRWITSEASRRAVHEERALHDAILVGVGTILADDPRLDVRLEGRFDVHAEGHLEGPSDGRRDGRFDGRCDGRFDGHSDGRRDGRFEGRFEGRSHGCSDGRSDGRSEGRFDGRSDGRSDGHSDGRFEGRLRNPRVVIVDSSLRTPPTARAVAGAWIYVTRPSPDRRVALEGVGATVIQVAPDAAGRPAVTAVLDDLAARGVTSVFVEGGGEVARAFLAADVAHRVLSFVAPVIVGGSAAPTPLGRVRSDGGDHRWVRLQSVSVAPGGDDLRIEGVLREAWNPPVAPSTVVAKTGERRDSAGSGVGGECL